jgi:hypothetical protein
MRNARSVVFLALLAALFLTDSQTANAFPPPPPFENCSDGCTCTVDWNNWNHVTAECPDASPADECSYGYSACNYYCNNTLEVWHWEQTQTSVSCWMFDFGGEGCDPPLSLEPPTEWTCDCLCWQ